MSIVLIIISVVIVALILGMALFVISSDKHRIYKKLRSGEKYLEELDYEAAIATYENVLQINHKKGKYMKKRILTIASLLVMTALFFIGCGQAEADVDSASNGVKVEESAGADAVNSEVSAGDSGNAGAEVTDNTAGETSDAKPAEEAASEILTKDVEVNETNFPDSKFRNFVSKNYDQDKDGIITGKEIEEIKTIMVTQRGIKDLTGIELFTSLENLYCENNEISYLDVSKCNNLVLLSCFFNNISDLNISNCSDLVALYCYNNKLNDLDISECPALEVLLCGSNDLTSLDVSTSPALKILDCGISQLSSLDISMCTALEEFVCQKNNLTDLDVSKCTKLTKLNCAENNISSVDLSGCAELTSLICYGNKFKKVDVTMCTKLQYLWDDNGYVEINAE